MDINVRVIKAVECCPTLYKGNASIEERQVVWQQLSEQMRVPESVLKTRWHLLCTYYQRCLEKRRSTDETNENETGADRNDFRYEAEMDFMTPYIHARIAIAAANAARKQQELALAGANDLTEPEFVITESDIEQATSVSNELSADYAFYEVESYEQEQEQEQEDLTDGPDAIIEAARHEEDLAASEYIQHYDESGNIVMHDIIYETGDQLSEDGGEIEIGDDELLHIGEQIEVQNEQIIEEQETTQEAEKEDEFITETYHEMPTTTAPPVTTPAAAPETVTNPPHTLRLPLNNGQKFIKLVPIKPIKAIPSITKLTPTKEAAAAETTATPTTFAQEFSLATRRNAAVVLKATPRVQVELTHNALMQRQQRATLNMEVADASPTKTSNNQTPTKPVTDTSSAAAMINVECTPPKSVAKENSKSPSSELTDLKSNDVVSVKTESSPQKVAVPAPPAPPQEQVSTINSTETVTNSTPTSTSASPPVAASTAASESTTDSMVTIKNERSEDTIFGELVAAMLKQMPPDRKRGIKRSIMDLLLT